MAQRAEGCVKEGDRQHPCSLNLKPLRDPGQVGGGDRQSERLLGNRDRPSGLGEIRVQKAEMWKKNTHQALQLWPFPPPQPGQSWHGLGSLPTGLYQVGLADWLVTGCSRGRWSEEGPDPQPTREWRSSALWSVPTAAAPPPAPHNLLPLGAW